MYLLPTKDFQPGVRKSPDSLRIFQKARKNCGQCGETAILPQQLARLPDRYGDHYI